VLQTAPEEESLTSNGECDYYQQHKKKSDCYARKVTLAATGSMRRIVIAVHQTRKVRCICTYCHEAVTIQCSGRRCKGYENRVSMSNHASTGSYVYPFMSLEVKLCFDDDALQM